jgi:hypothetical protein
MNKYIDAFLSLKGSVINVVELCEWVWSEDKNIVFDGECKFVYCSPFYFKMKNGDIYKIYSIQLDEYSLSIEKLSKEQYKEELKCRSEIMHDRELEEYKEVAIEDVEVKLYSDSYVESVTFRLSSNEVLILFSGDYEQENDGDFRVFSPDEMVLVFQDMPSVEKFGLAL